MQKSPWKIIMWKLVDNGLALWWWIFGTASLLATMLSFQSCNGELVYYVEWHDLVEVPYPEQPTGFQLYFPNDTTACIWATYTNFPPQEVGCVTVPTNTVYVQLPSDTIVQSVDCGVNVLMQSSTYNISDKSRCGVMHFEHDGGCGPQEIEVTVEGKNWAFVDAYINPQQAPWTISQAPISDPNNPTPAIAKATLASWNLSLQVHAFGLDPLETVVVIVNINGEEQGKHQLTIWN